MRRLFWVAVGAAGGIWAYQRGTAALENARERGVMGNVAVATATASKVATTATHVVALAADQGARLAARVSERGKAADDEPDRPTTSPGPER